MKRRRLQSISTNLVIQRLARIDQLDTLTGETTVRLERVSRIQGGYTAYLAGSHGQKTRVGSSTIDGLLSSVLNLLDFDSENLRRARDLFVEMTSDEIRANEVRLAEVRKNR